MHFRISFVGHLNITSLALYINVLMIIKNLNDMYYVISCHFFCRDEIIILNIKRISTDMS